MIRMKQALYFMVVFRVQVCGLNAMTGDGPHACIIRHLKVVLKTKLYPDFKHTHIDALLTSSSHFYNL